MERQLNSLTPAAQDAEGEWQTAVDRLDRTLRLSIEAIVNEAAKNGELIAFCSNGQVFCINASEVQSDENGAQEP